MSNFLGDSPEKNLFVREFLERRGKSKKVVYERYFLPNLFLLLNVLSNPVKQLTIVFNPF